MKDEKICSAPGMVQTFERMHNKLKKLIEQNLFHLTGTTKDSEDVVQEIIIKLWINWAKLYDKGEIELKDYVFIVVKNHVVNQKIESNRPKRNKRKFLMAYTKTVCEWQMHDEVIIKEGLTLHQRAIKRLAKKERIVYLYHLDKYSADEIAQILNKSKQTVCNRLSIAHGLIRTYMNRNYGWNISESGRKNYWKTESLN